MSSQTTYLITGSNRGLGLGLTSTLLLRPNTTVIAAVRTLSPSNLSTLTSLPVAETSHLIPIKIDSVSATDAQEAVKTLAADHNITKLDVVIANSGISNYYGPATSTPIDQVREHFEVNAVGPLVLFQAVYPLLRKSSAPKFVPISSAAGSIGEMGRILFPITAYGSSKAALNYIIRKIHFENEGLVAFALTPGMVGTDMGKRAMDAMGMEGDAPTTIEQSVKGMLEKIDNATREETSGEFLSFDGKKYAW